MKIYKIDLDYESYLFSSLYKENDPVNLKTIKEFEYIFFLINQEENIKLNNFLNYDSNYLEKLSMLGFKIPKLTSEKFNSYFWGQRENLELERKLNSKFTSVEIAKKYNWGFFQGGLVSNVEEVLYHLSRFEINDWILKSATSFSGIGHYLFKKDKIDFLKIEKMLKNEKLLLEPLYERIFDIGTTFIVENGNIKDKFMVLNNNSFNGKFKGGIGSSRAEALKQYVQKIFHYDLSTLDNITNEIAQEYLKMGATSNIQIDSFVYKENRELKTYFLVEVNYRKTMGLVIQSLANHFNESDLIEWKIYNNKESIEPNGIRLSPEGNYFQSFLYKRKL